MLYYSFILLSINPQTFYYKNFACTLLFTFFCFSIASQGPSYYVSNSVFRLLQLSVPQLMPPPASQQLAKSSSTAVATVPARINRNRAMIEDVQTTAQETSKSNASGSAPAGAVDGVGAAVNVAPSSTNAAGTSAGAGAAYGSEASSAAAAAAAVDALLQDDKDAEEEAGAAAVASLLEEQKPAPAPSTETIAPAPAPAPSSAAPSAPLSYLDIVRNLAAARVDGSGPAKPAAPTPAPTSSNVTAASAATGASAGTARAGGVSGTSHSIYVKQLPEQCSSEELHQLFSAHGTVVQVDHTAGRSYAFVQFDSLNSMRSVLAVAATQPQALAVRGQLLRIEERTSPGSGSGGAGATAGSGSGSGVRGVGGRGGGERRDRDRSGRDRGGGGGGPRGGRRERDPALQHGFRS